MRCFAEGGLTGDAQGAGAGGFLGSAGLCALAAVGDGLAGAGGSGFDVVRCCAEFDAAECLEEGDCTTWGGGAPLVGVAGTGGGACGAAGLPLEGDSTSFGEGMFLDEGDCASLAIGADGEGLPFGVAMPSNGF